MEFSSMKRIQQAMLLQMSDESKAALTERAKKVADFLAAAALCAVLSTYGADANADDFGADPQNDRPAAEQGSQELHPVARSALGMAIGGVVGYQFGGGRGKVVSSVLGALVGRTIAEKTATPTTKPQPNTSPGVNGNGQMLNPYESGAVIPELVKMGMQTHRGRGNKPMSVQDDQVLRREFDQAVNARTDMINACERAESIEANVLLGRRDREYDRLKSETVRTQDNFRSSKRQFFRDIQSLADAGYDMKPWNLMVGMVAATPDSNCNNYKSVVAIDRALNAELNGANRQEASNNRRVKY